MKSAGYWMGDYLDVIQGDPFPRDRLTETIRQAQAEAYAEGQKDMRELVKLYIERGDWCGADELASDILAIPIKPLPEFY